MPSDTPVVSRFMLYEYKHVIKVMFIKIFLVFSDRDLGDVFVF